MFKFYRNDFLNTRLRSLSESNQAVVGIVVAVLLIGLVVTILSVVQLIYVPNWMEEIESEHIDEVFNQFCQLKLVIDTQSAINITNNPIVTSITFGTNKIPFFMSTRAAGGVDIINSDESNAFNITILNNEGDPPIYYSLGSIKYTSANAYYIPEEQISFVYENGALITDQKAGYSLNVNPSFNYEEGNISLNLVNIKGVGGKVSMSGYDIEHIRTELYKDKIFNNTVYSIKNVSNLTITSDYVDVWSLYINAALKKGIADTDYEIISWDDGKKISILFYNYDKPDLRLKPTQINAQIGPGWIITE